MRNSKTFLHYKNNLFWQFDVDFSYGAGASSAGERDELNSYQSGTKFQNAPHEGARIFYNFLGDIIGSVPFLPIEINIPDTISQTIEYIGSWFAGNSQGDGSQEETLQRVLIDGILSLFPKESSK